MKKLAKLSFALAMILSIGIMVLSCKTAKPLSRNDFPNENSPNISGSWVLKSLNGKTAADIFKGKIPTMTIDFAEKRISGSAGCNNYSGGFTLVKGILSAPNLASTMMMCPEENQEGEFHAVLGQPNKVSIENGVLTLRNNKKVVAQFEKSIDTSMLLGEWKLESIDGGDISTLFGENVPTIAFDLEKSRLGGNTGCNRYNATYTLDGTTISVGHIMSTRRACRDAMQGEPKFTQAITGESTIEVTADKITFSKEGKTILVFVKDIK